MHIGMPTLVELDNLIDNVKVCCNLGFNFIEINMNLPEYQIDRLDPKELRLLQKENNIFFTFHLPEDLEIAHFNTKIREAHWHTVFETIELMKKIDSPILNMHMSKGIHFTLPTKKIFLYERYYDDYLLAFKLFSKQVADLIGNSNIKLAIENTGIYNTKYITNILDLLLQKNEFALTWDIGHDFSSGNKDRNYIQDNISKLKHMHIHDAKGLNNHLVLYDGEININKFLEIASERQIAVVVETKTLAGLKESIYRLKEQGYSF